MQVFFQNEHHYVTQENTEWHSHYLWQMDYYFNNEKKIVIKLEGRTIVVDNSFATLIPPYVLHKIEVQPVCDLLTIKFDPEDNRFDNVGVCKLYNRKTPELFNAVFNRKTVRDDIDNEITGHLLMALMLQIKRKTFIAARKADKIHDHRLKPAISYIHRNLLGNILLETLAKESGYSVNQFIRIFRKETGLTPMRYVCKHRIDKAIGLLKSSDLNIAQIAEALRYPDQHTFSKAFKKENGLSPLYFRKKHLTDFE